MSDEINIKLPWNFNRGLEEKMPENKSDKEFYYTEDTKRLFVGDQEYAKIDEVEELDDRVVKLEESTVNSIETKKQTLRFYRKLGEETPAMKPYTDNMRASMTGLNEFEKLGTGLFIHWGVYAVPAGNYTGTKQEGCKVTTTRTTYNTEWIMRDLGIPKDTYKAFETQFTSENWDADQLCQYAVDAGMGYVIITIKHHDGFSLYPTEYGYWDVRTSGARTTIIDELKEACNKYKLKFGLYISQFWDWMAEGGFGLNYGAKWNGSSTDLYTEAQHTEYMNRTILQINEFVTKYEPDILWYDPGTGYATSYVNMLRDGEYQYWPHVITNDRLDYGRNYGDYGTGERTIYLKNRLPVAESCFTMNNTWGYSDNNENSYYSTEKVFKEFIIYSLAYGQNCLMNIGPRKDGSIPEKQIAELVDMKNFTKSYGTFKNYKRINVKCMPKWGYALQLDGNRILCYVVTKNNPTTQDVVIDGIDLTDLESINVLTGGNAVIEGDHINVTNLGLDSKTKIGVVRLNFSMIHTQPDSNPISSGENVPSRVFPMLNNASWNFTNLAYNLRPNGNINYKTRFTWNSDTTDYTMSLNCDVLDTAPISEDEVITVVITDLSDNSTQTLVFNHGVFESTDTIVLTKNSQYEMKLTCSGTNSKDYLRLNSFSFNPLVVIIHPTSITLNSNTLSISVDGSALLETTISPDDVTDPSVTWSSDTPNVATVDNDGQVTGVSAGEARITATTVDGGLTATCIVVVHDNDPEIVHVDSITLNATNLNMELGGTYQLSTIITPTNATYKSVVWSSSDETIATVDENGLVTSLTDGEVTITAHLIYDELDATCDIVVEPKHPTGITLNKDSVSIYPGKKENLVATITPDNATHKDVVWGTSSPTIAVVDENGVVTAKSFGTATITATTVDCGKTASCVVNVLQETYDFLFEALSLDGSDTQGAEADLGMWGDVHTQWTIFGYVHNSVNKVDGTKVQNDNNATLYQTVVNASPWTGLRMDADNNLYPIASNDVSPINPRFLCNQDNWFDTINKMRANSKFNIDPLTEHYPFYFSRNGSEYKYSFDGIEWVTITGTSSTQLDRLKAANAILTVGYDYKRASGAITTTKYRKLVTDRPCCVAVKYESEYPFYTLFNKYYRGSSTVTHTILVNIATGQESMGSVVGSGEYNDGSTQQITAIPQNDYNFVQWNDGNTNATREIIVTEDATYTATFAIKTITINGQSNDNTKGLVSGSATVNYGQTVTLVATPNDGYNFIQWNDGNTNATREIIATENATYTATFSNQETATITAVSDDTEMGTVNGTSTVVVGSSVTIDAIPNEHYHFVQWNDGNTNATRVVNVVEDVTYTAYFAIDKFTISGLCNDDTLGSVSGSGEYEYGSIATLVATPNLGNSFSQWSDGETNATRTINVTENATYTAVFEVLRMVNIDVQSANETMGSATGTCSVQAGTTITITAVPNDGYRFVQWNDRNTNITRQVVAEDDCVYTAYFEESEITNLMHVNSELGVPVQIDGVAYGNNEQVPIPSNLENLNNWIDSIINYE